jgi:hypothetical protein
MESDITEKEKEALLTPPSNATDNVTISDTHNNSRVLAEIASKENSTMSHGFLKLIRSDSLLVLIKEHPNAFLLLTQIAIRARRSNCSITGLQIGEAYIGDFKEAGLQTEGQYRVAKDKLKSLGFIAIIDTRRKKGKNATIKRTTSGTLVKLLNTNIYDINISGNYEYNDESTTTKQRVNDDEQECKKDKKGISDTTYLHAKNSSNSRSAVLADDMLFDFEASEWKGIEPTDLANWATVYPCADAGIELVRMREWILGNPSKAKAKKLWRRFITGWLGRVHDKESNRQAWKGSDAKAAPDMRELVAPWHDKRNASYEIDVKGDSVTFTCLNGYNESYNLKFSDLGFKEQFENALRKTRFT